MKSRAEELGLNSVEKYQREIMRQKHLTPAQKRAIIETKQIAPYDRGSGSPLGGQAVGNGFAHWWTK
jgi:hypothetical protein